MTNNIPYVQLKLSATRVSDNWSTLAISDYYQHTGTTSSMTYMMDKVIHKKGMSWFACVTQRSCTDLHPPGENAYSSLTIQVYLELCPTTDGYLPMNSSNQNPVHFTSLPPFPYQCNYWTNTNYHFFFNIGRSKGASQSILQYIQNQTRMSWLCFGIICAIPNAQIFEGDAAQSPLVWLL